MSTQQVFHQHRWSYLHRVIAKKGGASPNIKAAIAAINSYHPEGFGVKVTALAECRVTRQNVAVLCVELACETDMFQVCLTHTEIVALNNMSDPRDFSPSLLWWMLKEKAAATGS